MNVILLEQYIPTIHWKYFNMMRATANTNSICDSHACTTSSCPIRNHNEVDARIRIQVGWVEPYTAAMQSTSTPGMAKAPRQLPLPNPSFIPPCITPGMQVPPTPFVTLADEGIASLLTEHYDDRMPTQTHTRFLSPIACVRPPPHAPCCPRSPHCGRLRSSASIPVRSGPAP